MDIDMAASSKLQDRQTRMARGVKAPAVVVVLGLIVVAGEHMPVGHAVADHATVARLHDSSASAAATTYFPSQYAAPTSAPEAHVEAF